MKIFRKLLCVIMVLMLCACGKETTNIRTYYSYSIYPVGYLLNRIGGNRINTISVQSNTIVQTATVLDNYKEILNESLYFFHIGDLEPYLEVCGKEIDESGVNQIDLGTNSIYAFKRYTPINMNGTLSFVESDYYEGDAFEFANTYKDDLFIWLDPIGMLSMAKSICNSLSSNYVEASEYFNANYETLESDLIALDAAYQNLATSLQKEGRTIKFVSMTPSFGSWQKAYGFEVYPVCLSRFGAIPTQSQLEIIKERIIKDGVEYIAYEPNMSSEMLNLFTSLESELGLKRVNLSNLSSLTVTQQTDNKDYLTIMYENLAVLENIATSIREASAETPTEEGE
ncbi:MAG: zinc ABC transporter substrate-binding protein [Erysipelotrichaceae bacterium]|nr:zinc ABC transporter substrate-binding protein [Erysipelotrichaceae bacterium]